MNLAQKSFVYACVGFFIALQRMVFFLIVFLKEKNTQTLKKVRFNCKGLVCSPTSKRGSQNFVCCQEAASSRKIY